ncbi:MAG: hypothetical protein U9Q08_04315 [Candidatus Omnitrophota bacterium]|nr:hypothetical protein [Candidatus Omnitrophota bacterium]
MVDNVPRKKRSMFVRILVSLLWLIPIVIVTNILIGTIVGGIAGAQLSLVGSTVSDSSSAGYTAGKNASIEFFQKYGLITFVCQFILWITLSITGKLPGTNKFVK